MRLILLITISLILSGCEGVNRLLEGPVDESPTEVEEPICSIPPIGEAPTFNVPIPDGCTRAIYHGALPLSGCVKVQSHLEASVHVFLKERDMATPWFILGSNYSGAYWYSFDKVTGIVTYHGNDLSLIEYCIYEYLPNEEIK